jgi:hypothetical protein
MSTATIARSAVRQTLDDINAAVEKIKNDQPQHFPLAASIGDAVRQGDLYIQLIDETDLADLSALYARVPDDQLANNLQLAPGNTKGSRHVIASTEGLTMWQPIKTDEAVMRHVYRHKGVKLPKNLKNFRAEYWSERDQIEAALALAGPIFKCATPNVVEHPEHGNWNLPAATYRVIFQRTVDEQERITRVLD